MHITVVCPHCQSRYQLDPSLRGKRMRCPNTLCRTIFEVTEQGSGTSPPAASSPSGRGVPLQSGAVGEVVPILRAESVAPVNDLPITPDDALAPADPARVPIPNEEGAGNSPIPEAVWAPAAEAPPVRSDVPRKIREQHGGVPPRPAEKEAASPETVQVRSRARRIMLGMALILCVALGGGVYLLKGHGAANEAERFAKAQGLYQNQDFGEATAGFQNLLRDFPGSAQARLYSFLVEMSAIRAAVYAPPERQDERANALNRMLLFLEINRNDPLLKEYHGDIWRTLQRLSRELVRSAEENHDALALAQAKRSWAETARFVPPAGAKVNDVASELDAEFQRVNSLLAARASRLELLKELSELATRGSAAAVRAGRTLAKNAGLDQDAEVVSLLEAAVKAHRARVVFTESPGPTAIVPPPAQDGLRSFYAVSARGNTTRAAPDGRTVLALARGVLYAQDAANGTVRWVRRVGVDTSVLPPRVPASPFLPELVVVVSSDSKSVTAVAVDTGVVIWEHALESVCLGNPVLVDGHLYVPTIAGEVEDIETAGGHWQGTYHLGQPLLVGGVHQPGTSLVYFPADSFTVYVLDVAKRVCAGVLYSGHAAGSLRGLPLIWNEANLKQADGAATGAGWLILTRTSGSDGLEMVPYALPIRQADQQPAGPIIKVKGDDGGSPWHDGSRVALATDAGLLALYGLRQSGNRDPLLFRLLADDYRVESPERAGRGRAVVLHADANNYWVMMGGQLHRLEATFTASVGPGLVQRWPQPLDIGSPLHAAQVQVTEEGMTVLFLATRDENGPTCWLRAIAAEQGKILWQRQLGMLCQEHPIASGESLVCPEAGGLLFFNSDARPPAETGTDSPGWQTAAKYVEGTGKISGDWTWARGTDLVHMTWSPGPTLHLRLFGKEGTNSVTQVALPALPQGTPALGNDSVLLPLANGVVLQVALGDGKIANGPDWRNVGTDEAQPGHIVALANNDFAITDGGRSITRIRWADARAWEKISSAEVAQRITRAPVALGNRLVVADASDTITLLEGERLAAMRRWLPGGKISAGPFVRDKHLGLVVGKNRLVWLDPEQDQPLWEYSFPAPIVGEPEVVDNIIVVADLQGRIVGLDPANGNPVGPGYRLLANEAPTTAPVGFGPGQLFLPLMDGTAMVLPLSRLR